MPDFFVPLDTTTYTNYHRELSAKSVIINANLKYIDHNRKKLKKQYRSFDAFNLSYEVPQEFIDDIIAEGEKAGVKPKDDEEMQRTLLHLRPQLKALVARDLWDMSEYFHVWNEKSDIVRRALDFLEGK